MEKALQLRERVYKWREANPDKYKELARKHMKTYYENNASDIKIKKKDYYQRKKAEKTQETAQVNG